MKPGKTLSFIIIGGSSFVLLAFFFGNWQSHQSAAQATPVPVPETKPENLTPVNQCLKELIKHHDRCSTSYNVIHSIMQVETNVVNEINAANCIRLNQDMPNGKNKECSVSKGKAMTALEGLKPWDMYTDNFDGGCMQVNYSWHKKYFNKRSDIFNPDDNLAAAKKIYREHLAQPGVDYIEAAGRYHSKTPKFKNRYLKQFKEKFNEINNQCIKENL